MQIKAPRLYRNRCGVYFFRVESGGKKRICLCTKFSKTANIRALQVNLDLERRRDMGGPKRVLIGRYQRLQSTDAIYRRAVAWLASTRQRIDFLQMATHLNLRLARGRDCGFPRRGWIEEG